jgi:hypothetical protein
MVVVSAGRRFEHISRDWTIHGREKFAIEPFSPGGRRVKKEASSGHSRDRKTLHRKLQGTTPPGVIAGG